MAFQKGHPRYGGRKKGTRNSKLASAAEIFERVAFNSLEKAIELIRDESLEMSHRVGLLKEVMKYQFPQLRAVEHFGNQSQVVIEDRRNQLIQVFSDPELLKAAQAIAEKLNHEEKKPKNITAVAR